jgi:hypothetical protein
MLFKNVAGQKIHIYAYNSATGAAKTGDAANITAYVSLDGTANAIDDTNPSEVDATNMPGIYVFDLTQAETNCNAFALYAKSTTSDIRIEPIIGYTTGPAATQTGDSYAVVAHADYGNAKLVRSTTPANTLSVDANHLVAVPTTQKVDLETIKTQTITCGAGVTFGVYVGGTGAAALASEVTSARMGALTDWIDGGRLDLILDAILADTDVIGAAGAGLTAVPWNAAWDAEVQSECTDALNGYDPPTKAELDSGLDALPTAGEIKTAMEAAGGHLALILEDTGTTLDGKIDTVGGVVDAVLADTGLLEKVLKNKRVLSKSGSVWSLTIFDDDGVTPLIVKALKDKDGNNLTDLAAGVLAQELANSV